MKVTKELKIPMKEFYLLLRKSLEYDISQSNHDIELKADASYTKELQTYKGVTSIVDVTIKTLQEDIIEIINKSNKDEIMTVYRLEPTGIGVLVEYSENLNTTKFIDSLNYRVMSFIYQRRNSRKILNQWIRMENYYRQEVLAE